MLGFERVIDFIFDAWDYMRPWVVVDPYEAGLVFTFGRPFRRGPKGDMVITHMNGWFRTGLHLKFPFAEKESMAITAIRTARLSNQSLTTKDGIDVVISSAVRYAVKDVVPLLCDIREADDVLRDAVAMTISEIVRQRTWEELHQNDQLFQLFLQEIRKKLNQYGFKIHQATFVNFVRAPAQHHIIPEEFTIKRDE